MSSATGRRLPPAQVDCMWWKQGYCARGKTCHFRHDEAMAGVDNKKADTGARGNAKGKAKARIDTPSGIVDPTTGPSASDPADPSPPSNQICTICLEAPDTFGLLLNCDHVFCLECIRNWRSSTSAPLPSNDELKSTSKTCPMCRSHSDYIIPSSLFPTPPSNTSSATHSIPPANTQKSEIVHRYLNRLSSIPCRYFTQSVTSSLEFSSPVLRPKCRFGNSCHYAHIHPLTKEPYIFSVEELQKPRRRPQRNRERMGYVEEMALMERIFADLGHDGGSDVVDEWGCDDEDEVDLMGFGGSEVEAFFEAGDVSEFLERGLEGLSLGFDLDWDELEYNHGWD